MRPWDPQWGLCSSDIDPVPSDRLRTGCRRWTFYFYIEVLLNRIRESREFKIRGKSILILQSRGGLGGKSS